MGRHHIPSLGGIPAPDQEHAALVVQHEGGRGGQGVLIEDRATDRADLAGTIPHRLHLDRAAALGAEQRVQLMGSSVTCMMHV